jgi:iron-sulfur cluster assembly accessory protein
VTVQAQTPKTVTLTDVAATKVKSLLDQEGRDDLRLRVAVQPGGCSGLRYQLFFDERSLEGDVVTVFPVGRAVDDDRQRAAVVVGAAAAEDDRDRAAGGALVAGAPAEDDRDRTGGVAVVVDRMSAPYLVGATIDFVDTIEKQGFTIDNPNATGSCACGDSFH